MRISGFPVQREGAPARVSANLERPAVDEARRRACERPLRVRDVIGLAEACRRTRSRELFFAAGRNGGVEHVGGTDWAGQARHPSSIHLFQSDNNLSVNCKISQDMLLTLDRPGVRRHSSSLTANY